jgi:hypothetical protein
MFVDGQDVVVAAVADLRPATLVVDVQPFVAPWGCGGDAMVAGAAGLSRQLAAAAPDLGNLVFATNARLALPGGLDSEWPKVTFVSAAHKPWRIGYLVTAPRPVVVVGDQVITDGLLAARLRGQFLQVRVHGRIPRWPRIQAAIGKWLARVIFSPMGEG